jgi:hypothetical protein
VPPAYEAPHAVIEPSVYMLEARVHPLVVITLRFIQLMVPLLLLKLMGQSKRGVTQIMEAQAHPLVITISRFKRHHQLNKS